MDKYLIYTPTDVVAVVSQVMELSIPIIVIEGEIVNIRVNKSRWLYFDIKDAYSIIHCFGTVYMRVTGFVEGVKARVMVSPRMHPQFGFSFTVQSIELADGYGEATKAKRELEKKLEKEGVFNPGHKKEIPKTIKHIGVIASKESAALADFVTLLDSYTSSIKVTVYDVTVQGKTAEKSILQAMHYFNACDDVDVVVLTRGGGSPEDLAVFNQEKLIRAVFSFGKPLISAIGHEVDRLLVERAADLRASTPSHAAEIIRSVLAESRQNYDLLLERAQHVVRRNIEQKMYSLEQSFRVLTSRMSSHIWQTEYDLEKYTEQLELKNPSSVMKRGYALLIKDKQRLLSLHELSSGDRLKIRMNEDEINAIVE